MGSLAEANGSPSGYRAAEPVSGNLAPPPKKHQLQFVPTWFRSTIASAIDTAPFGAPERHDCPAKPPAVRSYSAPSVTPFALRSLPYVAPLALGCDALADDVPT